MPYATTPDNVKLYYEEVGAGTPILFVHEFASDHRGWEPQMREFGKRHRCIAYSARGYAPSDVLRDAGAYSYMHVMRDCVAMLDHLDIDKAHLIGLSMGGYTSLQVALNHPDRVRSLVLAGTGSGSERWYTQDFHRHSQAIGDQFEREGPAAVAATYGKSPSRIPFEIKDRRGFAEFAARLAEHDAIGSANTSRGFQGARPSLYDFEVDLAQLATPALIVVGDEDERCIEPSLFLKAVLPAAGLVMFPKSGHVVNLEEPDLFNQVSAIFSAGPKPSAGLPATRVLWRPSRWRRHGTGSRSDRFRVRQTGDDSMLKWAVVFLVIAIIAGIFGFTGVEEASATIAKWLFGIFMVLFVGAVAIGLAIGAKLTS